MPKFKIPKGCVGTIDARELLGIKSSQFRKLIENEQIEHVTQGKGIRKYFDRKYLRENRDSIRELVSTRSHKKRGPSKLQHTDPTDHVQRVRVKRVWEPYSDNLRPEDAHTIGDTLVVKESMAGIRNGHWVNSLPVGARVNIVR